MGRLAYLEAKAEVEAACQESGGRLEAFTAGCRKTRAILSRLDCLKPNPRRCKRSPAGMTPGTGGMSCLAMSVVAGHLPGCAAPRNERGQGGEWVACVVLDACSRDVPRDHLPGASPRVTERP
jgi:hypothetical protein